MAGPALGGLGGLRFASKHPSLFAGVAALAPSAEPKRAAGLVGYEPG